MNRQQFIDLLSHPENLDESVVAQLGPLLEQYPYCQSAQLLYTKGLHDGSDIRYNDQLKLAAAYATDRKALYHLVIQAGLAEKIEEVEQEMEENQVANLPEVAPPAESTPAEPTPAPQIDISPLETEILRQAVSASLTLEVSEDMVEEEGDDAILETAALKTPASPPKNKHTLSNWMRVLNDEPVSIESEDHAPKPDKNVLIERFIKQEPSIAPAKTAFFSPTHMAKMSLVEDENFVTETLAKIYAQQGNHKKAILAYQKLSLKFPEKSSYFAALIKELSTHLK